MPRLQEFNISGRRKALLYLVCSQFFAKAKDISLSTLWQNYRYLKKILNYFPKSSISLQLFDLVHTFATYTHYYLLISYIFIVY